MASSTAAHEHRRARGSNSVPCPICGRSFALEDIVEHADICAARLERASKPPGKRQREPNGRQQRAPRRPQPSRSSTTAGRRKPQRAPTRLDAVGWREHEQREGLDASIVVDVIEGVEFRSQSSTVLRRRPHVPSPPPARTLATGGKRPMPPSAMQMDANDRWRQRQSWPPPQPMSPAAVQRFRQPPSRPEPHALPREASRAESSSCLPASSSSSATAAAEADQADQFLLKVKQTLGHGDKKHRLFHEVMVGFQSSVLDTVEVMEHVSALLHGHWSLLRQFNDFLPDGHRIEQLPPRLQGYSVCHDSAQPVPEAQAEELAVGFFNRLKDRFGEHSSELDSITHALAELSTPESALHDGELPLHGRPAEMLDHIRRQLHTWEHEDLWREFCEYVPASWTSREHVLTVVPASWPPPAGS